MRISVNAGICETVAARRISQGGATKGPQGVTAQRRKGWASWVAVAAAYLLAIQTLLVGLTLGSTAAPLQTSDAHAVLCLTGPSTSEGDASSNKAHVPNCCVLGCGMFNAAFAPPPQTARLISLQSTMTLVSIPARDQHVVVVSVRTPGNPRAPPLKV
ncbi:hypothetical protein AB4072_00870 [Microvirga sp. 2MCAF38]|uniref:hypothetical protein n=1 Tax=Microvirga sp. 2MCAF38 TaxID=3232989 RepID=UPI003F996889